MTQANLLLKCFKLLFKSKVCPKNDYKKWAKDLLYLHGKGWLYTGFEKGEPVMVASMYRIPEFKKEYTKEYPLEEKGDVLYIPFFASEAKNKYLASKLFKKYLKSRGDIKEIAFEKTDTGNIKRFVRRRDNG